MTEDNTQNMKNNNYLEARIDELDMAIQKVQWDSDKFGDIDARQNDLQLLI